MLESRRFIGDEWLLVLRGGGANNRVGETLRGKYFSLILTCDNSFQLGRGVTGRELFSWFSVSTFLIDCSNNSDLLSSSIRFALILGSISESFCENDLAICSRDFSKRAVSSLGER